MSGKKGPVFVYNKTKETFLATQVQVADSSLRRLVGLLGRRSLDPGSGLWIVPSNSIHTLGMRFSIDVIFLDRQFRVHHLCESVRPFRLTWPRWKAQSVLELPVHTIRRSRTEVGDELVISSADRNFGTAGESEPARLTTTPR